MQCEVLAYSEERVELAYTRVRVCPVPHHHYCQVEHHLTLEEENVP